MSYTDHAYVRTEPWGTPAPDRCAECGFTEQSHYTMRRLQERQSHPDCSTCQTENNHQPSHSGSAGCESGAIAAGGSHSHCSCDGCW